MEVTKPVLPGLHQNAEINCSYKGFPDIIHWQKDKQALQDDSKYTIRLEVNIVTGLTSSILTIHDVVSTDYAVYTCSATNSYGSFLFTVEFKSTSQFLYLFCNFVLLKSGVEVVFLLKVSLIVSCDFEIIYICVHKISWFSKKEICCGYSN